MMRKQDLRELVERYLAEKGCRGQEWAEFFRGLPLREAIKRAALALGPDGKKHSHQSRIPGQVLQSVADCLLSREQDIRDCQDFDSLLELVENCRVVGFGPVAVYDTAQRIGANLGLSPDKVYLHAGTREGARNLGLDVSRGQLLREELPPPLQELDPDDVESFLCRYKDHPTTGERSPSIRPSRRRSDCC